RRPASRGRTSARCRPHARALARPRVHPDRGGPTARARPPRPAPDRGARRRPERHAARRAPALRRVPPRRPRRPHRRGGRPLPREPARRRRRNTPRGVTGIVLALAASLSWGIADFVGPVKARVLGTLRVLIYAQVAGLLGVALLVAIR